MNHRVLLLKAMILFLITGILGFGQTAAAENPSVGEGTETAVEIQPEKEIPAEEMKGPVAEIREEETGIPEIPKPIKRKRLSPAEEVRLTELELRRTKGQITETEYQLEKDSLGREANIKF